MKLECKRKIQNELSEEVGVLRGNGDRDAFHSYSIYLAKPLYGADDTVVITNNIEDLKNALKGL